jgi:hypothetical protein
MGSIQIGLNKGCILLNHLQAGMPQGCLEGDQVTAIAEEISGKCITEAMRCVKSSVRSVVGLLQPSSFVDSRFGL